MTQIRYFILPFQERWTIRRDTRRMGAFGDEFQALATAFQLAAIDRVRGHTVQVMKREQDGCWTPCPFRNQFSA